MAFFLVDLDRNDGSVRLLSSELFDTRDDAMRGLGRLAADGVTAEERDVYMCSLDAATPVLLLERPSAPPVETAAAWEAPTEIEEASTAGIDSGEMPAEPAPLADALRRAATTMESAGIVAPEPVWSPPAEAPAEEFPAEESSAASSAAEEIPSQEALPESTLMSEPVEDKAGAEVDESVAEVEELAAEPLPEENHVDAISASIASLGVAGVEPVAEETVSERTSEIEDVVTTWPWENVTPLPEIEAAEEVAEPVDIANVSETEVEEFLSEDDSDVGMEMPGAVAEETETVSPEEETPAGYEPGTVELHEYTCDDCVYSNTCPKAGESSPADCGSFQWRSV